MTAPTTTSETGPTSPAPVKPRRNARAMLLGVVVAIICGLLAVWAVNRAGTTRSVVVVTNDIAAGDQVTEKDLGTTQVNGGEELTTVPGDALRSLVGRRANTAIPAGSLANDNAFVNRLAPRDGDVILGVALAPGQLPHTGLQNGDVVRIVLTAPDSASKSTPAAADPITAVVLAVGDSDRNGRRLVDLSVPNGDADRAAKAAGTEKIAVLNVAPGGTGITTED